MKGAIFIFLIAVSALGFVAFQQAKAIADQRSQIDALSAKVDVYIQSKNLSLQAQCAKQAEQEFDRGGYGKLDGFVSHYNDRLNKCFMLIDSLSRDGDNTKSLSDAFEGKTYGEYFWMMDKDKNKKYWEVPPRMCHVTLSSGEDKKCNSSDEFDVLVKSYLE